MRTTSSYAAELRSRLRSQVFRPAPLRLLWLSRAQHRWALLEAGLSWATLLALAIVVRPSTFAPALGIPLIVGSGIIMSFILTNHSLSPHAAVNAPLVNSLSVTLPRFLDWLTLGFGCHVEHHLFPAVSGRHARELGAEVRRRWPLRYQSYPTPRPSPASLLAVACAASVACSGATVRNPPASEPPPVPAAPTMPVDDHPARARPDTDSSWDPHESPPATSEPAGRAEPDNSTNSNE